MRYFSPSVHGVTAHLAIDTGLDLIDLTPGMSHRFAAARATDTRPTCGTGSDRVRPVGIDAAKAAMIVFVQD